MKQANFITRVMATLKGGDDAKITSLASKLEKWFEKQIRMRKEEIETIGEKIVDAKETIEDAISSVDIALIDTTEKRETYCPNFVGNIQSKRKFVKSLEAQLKTLSEEITELEETRAVIFAEPAKTVKKDA